MAVPDVAPVPELLPDPAQRVGVLRQGDARIQEQHERSLPPDPGLAREEAPLVVLAQHADRLAQRQPLQRFARRLGGAVVDDDDLSVVREARAVQRDAEVLHGPPIHSGSL